MMVKFDKRILLVMAVLMMLVIIPASFAADVDDANVDGISDVSTVDAVSESAVDTVDVSTSDAQFSSDLDTYDEIDDNTTEVANERKDTNILKAGEDYITTPSPSTVNDYAIGDSRIIVVSVSIDSWCESEIADYLDDVFVYIGSNKYVIDGVSPTSHAFNFNLNTVSDYLVEGQNTLYFGVNTDILENWGYTTLKNPLTVNAIGGTTPQDGPWSIDGKTDKYATLANAVDAAVSGDTIIGAAGTVEIATSTIQIAKDLTIKAVNSGDVLIKGGNFGSIFNVSRGSTLSLENIDFKDFAITTAPNYANAIYGVCIRNNGTLNAINCNFANIDGNQSNVYSAAIVSYNILNVDGCTFDNLTAYYGYAIGLLGGQGTIENSVFTKITPRYSAACIHLATANATIEGNTFEDIDSKHHMINIGSSSTANINNNTFKNLKSHEYAMIYAGSGANSIANINGNIFENCTTNCSNQALAGAIFIYYGNITHNTFKNCQGIYGSSGNSYAAGAISIRGTSYNGDVKYNSFIDNSATSSSPFSDIVSYSKITADYNYWGSNEGPSANSFNASNVTVNNWAIITLDDVDPVVGVPTDLVFRMNTYNTSEGVTGDLPEAVGDVEFTYTALNADDGTLSIKDGVGTVEYTGTVMGNEKITLSNGDEFSFEVTDASSLLYVDTAQGTAAGPGTADAPYKTIAQALNVATAGKTIIIRSGTYTEKDLIVNKDLTIKADNDAAVIIDANQEGRVFIVEDAATLTLKDLTLINGLPDYDNDDPTIDGKGGGIIVDSGSLIADNINVYNCTSGSGGAIASVAGATGLLNITGSSFIDNKIDDDEYLAYGSVNNVYGGGAIYSQCANLIIKDSIFSHNLADDAESEASGGAIYIASAATITGTTFSGNHANRDGGAVYVDADNTNVINISGSIFTSNEAEYNGGAIGAGSAQSVNVFGNDFNDNEAYYGGAIYTASNNVPYTIFDNEFNGNSATSGGTIYIRYGVVNLTGNTIGTSTASTGKKIYIAGGTVNAVTTFLGGETVNAEPGKNATLTATITDDQGNEIKGGSITFTADGNTVKTIDISGTGEPVTTYEVPATATEDIVISGSWTLGGTVVDGALHPAYSYWFIEGKGGYETLAGAVAAAVDGDVIYGLPDTYTVNGVNVNKAVTIKANESGSIVLDGEGKQIFNISANVNLINLTLTNGINNSVGGLIMLRSGDLSIANSTFKDTISSSNGVAIYMDSSSATLTVENCEFKNLYGNVGAAILQGNSGSKIVVKDSVFDNITGTYDGFVINSASNVEISGSNFTNCNSTRNTAGYFGAVFTKTGTNLTITDSLFKNIKATKGAAIYFDGNTLNVSGSIFDNVTSVAGNCIIYTSGKSNINYNIILNSNYGISTTSASQLNADYNYFGNNVQPTTSMVTANTYTHWTILNLTAENTVVEAGSTVPITVDFTKATDGTDVIALPDKMPDYTFELAATKGTIDSPVTTVDGLATANYVTPSDIANGEEVTITATPGDASLVLTGHVLAPSWFIGETGYMTLAEAVEAAVEGDIIIGLPGTYDVSNIAIAKNITIKANESDEIVLHVADTRFASVTDGNTLNLENLIMENGIASVGGILNVNNASVNIDKCTFRDTAIAGSGTYISAVYGIDADISIKDSKFDNISTRLSGTGNPYIASLYGLRSNVEIINTTFTNIKAPATMYGSPLMVSGSELTVKDSEFSESSGATGAIYITGGNTVIDNTKFISNNATMGSGGVYGAIGSNITITGSTFENLLSNSNGGAISTMGNKLDVTGSLFINNKLNKTSNNGGAIYTTVDSNINYNVFINNSDNRPVHQGNDVYTSSSTKAINVDNNYFGTNDKPTNESLSSKTQFTNWIVLELTPDGTPAKGAATDLILEAKSTDGETVTAIEQYLPELVFDIAAQNGAVDPAALTLNADNQDKNTTSYTTDVTGEETITVSLFGETAAVFNFNVKTESNLTIEFVDENAVITLKSGEEALPGQTITGTLNNEQFTKTTGDDGTVTLSLAGLSGKVNVTANFDGSGTIYEDASASAETVLSADTILDIDVVDDEVTVTLTDSEGNAIEGANITYFVNGTETGTITTGPDGSAIIDDLEGKVNLKLVYAGDDEAGYSPSELSAMALIIKNTEEVPVVANVTIELSVVDGEVVAYVTDLDGNPLANKALDVTVNGEAVDDAMTDEDGYWSDVLMGNSTVIVSCDVDGLVANASIVYVAEEFEEIPVGYIILITLCDNGTTIEITLNDIESTPVANGEVIVYLSEDDDGTVVKLDGEGTGFYDFDNTQNQTIEVTYTDENDAEWSSYFDVIVSTEEVPVPVPVPVVANVTIELSVVDGEVVAYVTDLDGNALADKAIGVTVNGEAIDGASTNASGYWTYEVEANSTVVVSCSNGNDALASASIVYEVDEVETPVPVPVPVVANGTMSVETTDDAVVATLVDSDGEPIANATVTAVVNGEEQNFTTGADGKVSVPVDGNATVELSYVDPENGAVVSYTTKVVTEEVEVPVVVPVPIPVVANGTMSVETTDDAVVATLVDSDGEPIANATVTAVVNGEEQNFTTGADGKVSVPVDGNATVELSYVDPENGAVVSYTTKVVTEEVEVPVVVPVPVPVVANATISLSTEDGKTIIANLKDLDGKAIANATLIAKVNGKETNYTTDTNGQANIPVNENTTVEVAYTDSNKATVTSSMSLTVITNTVEINKTIEVPPIRNASKIICENMNTIAVAKADGRIGEYFYVNLVDANGKALANKSVQIGFNGKVYNRTTNETGGVKLQINLAYKGDYTFAIAYLGDDNYNGSFVVAKITVKQQTPTIKTSSKTYKASAKTKALTATFTTVKGNPIEGKTVQFTVNGKTYSGKTNAKGIATVKVSLSKKGTYSFTAKYAGDDTFKATSASAKLTIK